MWLFNSRRPAEQPPPVAKPVANDDQLLNQRVVLLRGPFEDEESTQIIAKLLFLQYQNAHEPITLLIDSPGGSVVAGMAIIDTIKKLTPPVHTRCEGRAQGMAAIILASGQHGERVVVRGSSVSLTPTTAGKPGIADSDPRLQRTQMALAKVLATATGRPAEAVSTDMVAGRSFEPDEAVEYGLADRVAK